MPIRFLSLRVWHPNCWMLDLCAHHRDVCVESRGVSAQGANVHAEAVIRGPDRETLERALRFDVPEDVHREVLHVGETHAEVYLRYPAYRSVFEASRRSGFLLVGSVFHTAGHERWEVLAEADRVSEGLAALREVADVKVERISPTKSMDPPPVPEGLFGALDTELSDRQYDVLRQAVGAGYYAWPRGKNIKRLASEMGVSAPTYLEHIRRAESRVVPALVAELERRRGRRPPPV